MKTLKITVVLVMAAGLLLSSGCQPWQKKYETCQAEYDNLQALFEGSQESLQQCTSDRDMLNRQLASCQDDLRVAREKPKTMETGLEGEGGVYDPSRGTVTVPLASDVLFDSGKATLKSASQTKLNRIAGIIKQRYASKEVSVVGHTDTDPIKKSKWQDNWELSAQRSLAVTRYLISQGINAEQLIAGGRGEFHPIGGNKSENRRVEIVVHMFQ
jgi:chemotaxis protein MotB